MEEFVVRTPEDVLPAIKKLRAGKSVICQPHMWRTLEEQARKEGLRLLKEEFGWGYEIRAVGRGHEHGHKAFDKLY